MNFDSNASFATKRPLLLTGLTILVYFLFIMRAAPLFWAKSQTNLFVINLVKTLPPEAISLEQEICSADVDKTNLRRMQSYFQQGQFYNANFALHKGFIACLKGNLGEARAAWSGGEEDFSKPVRSFYAAILAFVQGEKIEAEYMLEFSEYGYNRCSHASAQNDLSEAIAWCEFSFIYQPNEQMAQELASLYEHLGDENAVQGVWLQLQDAISSDSAAYWRAQGEIANLEQDYESAAIAYLKAGEIAETGGPAEYYLDAGLMWSQIQEYSKAETAYLKAIDLDSQKLELYIALGNLYRFQNKFSKANQWYKKAQSKFPLHHSPPFYLGLVAREQGQYDEALNNLDRSLELREESPHTLYAKALTLQAMERKKDAILTLEEAISINDNPPESWGSLIKEWSKIDSN